MDTTGYLTIITGVALTVVFFITPNAYLLSVYKCAIYHTDFIAWQGDKGRADNSNRRFQLKFLAFTAYV